MNFNSHIEWLCEVWWGHGQNWILWSYKPHYIYFSHISMLTKNLKVQNLYFLAAILDKNRPFWIGKKHEMTTIWLDLNSLTLKTQIYISLPHFYNKYWLKYKKNGNFGGHLEFFGGHLEFLGAILKSYLRYDKNMAKFGFYDLKILIFFYLSQILFWK